MRQVRAGTWFTLLVVAATAAASAAACGGSGNTSSNSGGANAGGNGPGGSSAHGGNGGGTFASTGGSGTGGSVHSYYPCDGCKKFPGDGAKTCTPAQLGPAKIAYPSDGLLLPPNMNVLEVQFVPPTGATLFEVDFENSVTDVRVETECDPIYPVRDPTQMNPPVGCAVTLPQAAWNDIAQTNADGDPVKVTVRSTVNGSCVSTSTANISIDFAKEDLSGGIYYWQSAVYGMIGGKSGGIYSHDFGTFDPTPTPFYEAQATGTCVGCHNVSRDGKKISLAVDDPDGDDEFSDVKTTLLDVATRTPIIIAGNVVSPGFQTFTSDHTQMIASTYKTTLKNAGFDVFNGDTGAAVGMIPLSGVKVTQPDLAKDDAHLVFVQPQANTVSSAGDHHFLAGSIYKASYDAGANSIGTPTLLLQGDLSHNYYYPSISPDGAWIVLDEAPGHDAFYNTNAEVKLVRMSGSQKLVDLPALNKGKGLTNSWPRWSPFVQTYKNHKILWVTFSSNRDYGLRVANQDNPMTPGMPYPNCYPPESPTCLDPNDTTCCTPMGPMGTCNPGTTPHEDTPQPLSKMNVGYEGCAQPQIWMAAIIIDPDASLDSSDRSFPAFWLPFQNVGSHNHTAQWVEAVQGGGGSGGGGGGGSCGMAGDSCGPGSPCCSSVICCNTTCTDLSDCIH